MMKTKVLCNTIVLSGLCLSYGGPRLMALQKGVGEEVRVDVREVPRPMSEALRQIERQFATVVTYEDVSYVDTGDIVDVTRQVRRDNRIDRPVLGRRPGSIALTYRPTDARTDVQIDEVLAQLVHAWNTSGTSGEFRVQRVEGGHHVIPTMRRGRDGSNEPDTSPLESVVSLPFEQRSGLETMFVLADAVSASTGRVVKAGIMPMNLMTRVQITAGAQKRAAREVLWEILQQLDPALSWQVLCEVGNNSMCAINIHSVRLTG